MSEIARFIVEFLQVITIGLYVTCGAAPDTLQRWPPQVDQEMRLGCAVVPQTGQENGFGITKPLMIKIQIQAVEPVEPKDFLTQPEQGELSMNDDEALLFYAQAARRAVRELAELEAKQEPNWSDRRHYVFCEHSTHPIFIKKLVEKTRSSDQGLRFAGHYGLYQFERAMTYKCDN